MRYFNELSGYEYLLVSTTAKVSESIRKLPDKNINGYKFASYLITDEKTASDFFQEVDGVIKEIFIDVERKKKIDLMEVAKKCIKSSNISSYKPNDITVEAADQLLLELFDKDIPNKNILVYGTGNIAFKVALRLLDRNCNVAIGGRDSGKVDNLVNTLNFIKPKFSTCRATCYPNDKGQFNGIISFVSADKIITSQMTNSIMEGGFAIDGGIGNFHEDFIQTALKRNISLLRLDVRLGNQFLLATLKSKNTNKSFFESIVGTKEYDGIHTVAGGIIGEKGTIILDQIKQPTQIIGVANGYGGVKNEEQLTEEDRKHLQYVKDTLL